MTSDQLAEFFAFGESRNVEFKSAGPRTDDYLRGVTIRAILGMANTQDGGYVFIGVSEGPDKTPVVTGLDDAQLASWTYDDLSAIVSAYADPYVTFTLEKVAYRGKTVVVVKVSAFDDIPVICKKNHPNPQANKSLILRNGALYTRTRDKPETREIPSQTEMREILTLAIDKGLATFIKRAGRADLWVPTIQPSDDDQFRQQIKDLL